MLSHPLKSGGDRLLRAVNTRLLKAGVPPWAAPAGELLTAAASGYCFAARIHVGAVVFFAAHGYFDYLDGGLRRAAGRPRGSPAAESSHALVDKAAEAAILSGIAIGQYAPWWLAIAALATSVAATAAGLYLSVRVGIARERSFFDRTDRMLLLFVALILHAAPAGLIALLIMNCSIIIQRAIQAWRR